MEYVLTVARNASLCEMCQTLRYDFKKNYDELLDATIRVGRENANAAVDIEFEPYVYAANYKHSFEDPHPLRATMRWIYHGYPQKLFHNRFRLNVETAGIIHSVYKKHVYVVGNSPGTPELLKRHPIPDDAFVVRFNKAMLHETRMDLCVFNDVLYDKMYENIRCLRCRSVVIENIVPSQFDSMRKDGALFTTGLLFVLWLTKFFTMYASLTVIGFDMVGPGERAHYFDDERPSKRSPTFAGHDADYERRLLAEYEGYPYLEFKWIRN